MSDIAGASAEVSCPALPSTVPELAAMLGTSAGGLQVLANGPYATFTRPKRNGSTRLLAEPAPELKEAQRMLLRAVWSGFRVHDAAHGVAGRSALTNATAHVNAAVVLKLDIVGFFPSIGAGRIHAFLVSVGASNEVATMLAALATRYEGGVRRLPQGAPTSNAIADVLCHRLDARLSGLAAKMGAVYTRYVDDLTFSWRSEVAPFSETRNAAAAIVAAEGFRLNHGKTRVLRQGTAIAVTGYLVDGDTPRVPREMRRRLRAAEHNVKHGKGDPESVASLRAYVGATVEP